MHKRKQNKLLFVFHQIGERKATTYSQIINIIHWSQLMNLLSQKKILDRNFYIGILPPNFHNKGIDNFDNWFNSWVNKGMFRCNEIVLLGVSYKTTIEFGSVTISRKQAGDLVLRIHNKNIKPQRHSKHRIPALCDWLELHFQFQLVSRRPYQLPVVFITVNFTLKIRHPLIYLINFISCLL